MVAEGKRFGLVENSLVNSLTDSKCDPSRVNSIDLEVSLTQIATNRT